MNTAPAETTNSIRSREASVAPWHTLAIDEAARRLDVVTTDGLCAGDLLQRTAQSGPNEIREAEPRRPWRMLLDQFTDFMIVVLMIAAIVSGVIGDAADAAAILVIVLLNGILGFVQEYRAEKAMAALRRLAAASARVVRDGRVTDVPAAELVPGDVVLLEAGNVVPADLRLVEAAALRIEEAALTGESVPIEKTTGPLADPSAPLGDRVNMAYKGTIVAYGRARGLVVATGMQTELGAIAAMLAGTKDEKTPLQQRLARFGHALAVVALAICTAVFLLGLARGEPLVLMFLTAVSLAVAAIPEALPAVITIALALGARRMVVKNALIRRLPAVETLGAVTYICSDKTGTLTQNRMRVEAIHVGGGLLRGPAREDVVGGAAAHLLRALALNNDAELAPAGKPRGDPTEIALLEAARDAGFEKSRLAGEHPRVGELPFDSERKCMTTVHRVADGHVAYTKGAPERVLERCNRMWGADGIVPLTGDALARQAEAMAAQGMRVIAVAFRPWPALPANMAADEVEVDLVFLGLVGMIDPPRPEAAEAVSLCRSAGITPVMITGDHPATARAIAVRLGIIPEAGRVLTGQDLARLHPGELVRIAGEVRVYARVDPAQKISIVAALRARGELVAMTGDGVNDAPALKNAQIGIAMGRIGTDVAREASDMVLLDDNFATIVAAVREGRRIFDNILKFIRFVMAGNLGEITVIVAAPLFGLPLPLLPIQLLWVNLVTDGLPGLALAMEPEERAIMQRPPRHPDESIFARGMWQHILWVGLAIGAISIATQAWGVGQGNPHWQTMVFTALTFCQMFHVLAIRSTRESLFTIGLAGNMPLLGAVGLTAALQLAVIYLPFLNPIFETQALTMDELAATVLLPALVLVGVEFEKWLVRRGWIYAARRHLQPTPSSYLTNSTGTSVR